MKFGIKFNILSDHYACQSQIKQPIQNITHQEFNSVLLNEYPDGGVGMGWHSDDDKELGINPIIASVSLWAERDFLFRHKKDKSKEPVKHPLIEEIFSGKKGSNYFKVSNQIILILPQI